MQQNQLHTGKTFVVQWQRETQNTGETQLFLVWQLCQDQLQHLEGLNRGVETPFHCSGQIQLVPKGKNRITCPREAERPLPTEIKAQFGLLEASN